MSQMIISSEKKQVIMRLYLRKRRRKWEKDIVHENIVTVEVDVKYIKGMINNPDIQPSATINHWITGILLFSFRLRYIPGKDHAPADGLSRSPQDQEDPIDKEDIEDWLDQACVFGIKCLNRQLLMPSNIAKNSNDGAFPNLEIPTKKIRITSPGTFVQMLVTSALKIPRTDKAKACNQRLKDIENFL